MKDSIKIELRPNLNCCIECMAERYYWELVDEYMKSSGDEPEMEEKIEMLRIFLDEQDIEKIRSETEELLIEGKEPIVILRLNGERFDVEIEGERRE